MDERISVSSFDILFPNYHIEFYPLHGPCKISVRFIFIDTPSGPSDSASAFLFSDSFGGLHFTHARDGSKIHCLGVVLLEQKMATTEMVRDGLCCGCRRQSRTRIQRTRKAGGLTFFHTCVQCEAQRKTLVGVLFTHWKVAMDVEKCLPLSVAEGVRKEEWKETSRHTLLPGCFPSIFHLPLH